MRTSETGRASAPSLYRIIGDDTNLYESYEDAWADLRHGFDGDEAAFDAYCAHNQVIEKVPA